LAKIYVLSKSISSKKIIHELGQKLGKKPKPTIAIITTAHRYLKSKSNGSIEAEKYLNQILGFNTTFVDIDKIPKALNYDAYYFVGGDPIYLMNSIIQNHFYEIFISEFKKNKTFIGSSAGAVIFGSSLMHISFFAPEYLSDNPVIPESLGFINNMILPHANMYKNQIIDYERMNPDHNILTVNDGYSFYFSDNIIRKL
jgi:peptidase E